MLALCLFLLAAAPDDGFALAVEASVHGFGRVTRYDQVLPPRQARLLRNLANDKFDCREEAERSIREIGPSNLRLLTWGSWSRDAEVASRCRRMLADRFICDHCAGSGECPSRRDDRYCGPCLYLPGDRWHEDRPHECLYCRGTGDSRFNP